MKYKPPQLKDGSEWADHEDCIIGDETGLQNLIIACKAALKDGEYFGDGLGDYVGVKKLDLNWFQEPKDSAQTRYANFGLAAILIILLAIIIIGLGTIMRWIF